MTARRPKPKRETVEMIDGRTYYSFDNWQTVWLQRGGNRSRVDDKQEADKARFLAVSQASWTGNTM